MTVFSKSHTNCHIPSRLVPSALYASEVICSLFTSGQEEKTGDQIAIKSPSKGSGVSWNVYAIK